MTTDLAQRAPRYYFVAIQNYKTATVCSTTDSGLDSDNLRWDRGNYFLSYTDASAAADQVNRIFDDALKGRTFNRPRHKVNEK